MERWELFEENVKDYLKEKIKIDSLKFVACGKSDSTSSDIDIIYNGKHIFSLEVKLAPSQCGQFVVIKDKSAYKYSKKNIGKENQFTREIIAELNKRKGIFGDVGTRPIHINIYTDAFYGWVFEHYKNKKVKFVITSSSPSNFQKNFVRCVNLSDFKRFFKLSACLRRKKSGSRIPAKKDFLKISNILKEKFGENFSLKRNYQVVLKNKPDKKRIYLSEGFILARIGESYRVRKLSTTNNANVIFSLKYIGPKESNNLSELRNEIEKQIQQINC